MILSLPTSIESPKDESVDLGYQSHVIISHELNEGTNVVTLWVSILFRKKFAWVVTQDLLL